MILLNGLKLKSVHFLQESQLKKFVGVIAFEVCLQFL